MKNIQLVFLFCFFCVGLVFGVSPKGIEIGASTQVLPLQMRAVVSRPEGLLILQNNKVTQYDTVQAVRWEHTFSILKVISNYAISSEQLALVGISPQQKRLLIVAELKKDGRELVRISLSQDNVVAVALMANKSIVTVADSAGQLQLTSHSPKNKVRWTRVFTSLQNEASQPKLLALANGGLLLTNQGEVWGLDDLGQIQWHFDGGQDQVTWNNLKVLRNGHVLLVGSGIAAAFDPGNVDGRILCINPLTGKQLWLKTLGEFKTKEMAIDAIEEDDGSLLVLLQETAGASIIKINTQQEAMRLGRLSKPFTYEKQGHHSNDYYQLLQTGPLSFAAWGRHEMGDGGLEASDFFIQSWGKRHLRFPSWPFPNKKSNLYGLMIGVEGKVSEFAVNDAHGMTLLLNSLEGKAYDSVRLQTLTTAAQTTTTAIASAVEGWPSRIQPQPDDWLVLFLSSGGLAYQNDFRLWGSDQSSTAKRSTSVSLRILLSFLNSFPGRKLVLLDASPGGAFAPLDPQNYPLTNIITASQNEAYAFEDSIAQHGTFTKALIEGLGGKADANQDNTLLISELYAYLSETVPAMIRQATGRTQQPAWLLKAEDEVIWKKQPLAR